MSELYSDIALTSGAITAILYYIATIDIITEEDFSNLTINVLAGLLIFSAIIAFFSFLLFVWS
jgi:hypothetical protein